MAHLATRRFNYWSQLGILAFFCGAGLFIGGLASLVPALGKLDLQRYEGVSRSKVMEDLLRPENATILRWMQFITTLFVFFLPAVFYALLCHKKPFVHLGFNRGINLPQVLTIVFIMMAALPVVSLLQEITEMFPW